MGIADQPFIPHMTRDAAGWPFMLPRPGIMVGAQQAISLTDSIVFSPGAGFFTIANNTGGNIGIKWATSATPVAAATFTGNGDYVQILDDDWLILYNPVPDTGTARYLHVLGFTGATGNVCIQGA